MVLPRHPTHASAHAHVHTRAQTHAALRYPITEDRALAVLTSTGGSVEAAAAVLADAQGRDAALELAIEELAQRLGVAMDVAREAMAAAGGDGGAALAMLSADHAPAGQGYENQS